MAGISNEEITGKSGVIKRESNQNYECNEVYRILVRTYSHKNHTRNELLNERCSKVISYDH